MISLGVAGDLLISLFYFFCGICKANIFAVLL